jgi:cobalt/nickel transport system permease protein
MRHDFLDRYSRLASPVHRLPAGVKLLASLGVVLLCLLLPLAPLWVFAIPALVLVALALLSRVPPLFLLQRLLFFEPLILGIAAFNLLRPGGELFFLAILIRSTLSLFTMILLANTTPFHDLLRVFRRMGFPSLFITVLALMYRYLFVLVDEAERMARARKSRTFERGRVRLWHSAASVIVQLFLRSSERAERIFAAMTARGWK